MAPAPLRDIRLLIFDLDGTLVDSLDDLVTAVNLTRGDAGMAPLPREQVVPLVGFGSLYLVQRCLAPPGETLAGPALEAAHARYLQHYNGHLLDQTRLHDGALAMLERYRTRRLAVVTNKLEAESRRILAGLGVLERFAAVVGGDTLAEKKPDPLPLRHVMALAGAAPDETVMIGDGVNDVLAGRAAGVHTVAVTFGVDSAAALRALQPGYVIDHMCELQNLIG